MPTIRASCQPLSNPDANVPTFTDILHETFSRFSPVTLVIHKTRPVFREKWQYFFCHWKVFRWSNVPEHRIPENGQIFFTSTSGLFRSSWRKNCYQEWTVERSKCLIATRQRIAEKNSVGCTPAGCQAFRSVTKQKIISLAEIFPWGKEKLWG